MQQRNRSFLRVLALFTADPEHPNGASRESPVAEFGVVA
jgi:hypothetical protein